MADGAVIEKKSLSDLMLAMDVVDTLRHRRLLVERELHSDQRDEQLLNRLREIYLSQGMEVTDAVLRAGVKALREERFTYRPPEESLAVRLAHLYVQRGNWGVRLLVVLTLVILVWLGWGHFVSGPAEQRLQRQVVALNDEIERTGHRIQLLTGEMERIAAALDKDTGEVPSAYRKVADGKQTDARALLRQAADLIESAGALNQPADLDSGNFAGRSAKVGERLHRQQAVVGELEQTIRQAGQRLADIDSLKILPGQLGQLREASVAAAREKEASGLANRHFETGRSALRAGEIGEAEAALAELRSLHARLLQRYSLLVVSREGEQSGVWRVPERNPNARNYYLIVEATASDGKVLTLEITNEEDGRRVEADKWGLRVSERDFRRIAADKRDDGIIQQRRIGEKRRGYLNPEYLVESDGGAITRW